MSAPSRPEITDSAALRELIRRVAVKESDPAAITRHTLGIRAVRLIAKEVLKDLWREAKRLHEEAVV